MQVLGIALIEKRKLKIAKTTKLQEKKKLRINERVLKMLRV